MKIWTKLSFFGFLFLLVNSGYLVSFGEPTLFYISNVLLHVAVGVLLVIPFVGFVSRRFTGMSIMGKGGVIFLAVGGASGGYLMVVGATTPNRWLLVVHIVAAVLGTVLCTGALFHRARQPDASARLQKVVKITRVVFAFALVFPIGAKIVQHYRPNPDYLVENPFSPPTSMYEEGAGPDGHFFPRIR